MIKPKSKVKIFELKDNSGATRSFNEFLGKKTLLFFYVKNNTTGCTIEVCSFNEQLEMFDRLNVNVVGISNDGWQSHLKFSENYGILFPLLSDPNNEVINQFGVLNKQTTSKRELRAKRISFLIDENGIVIKVFENVKPSTHVGEVVEYIKKLNRGEGL